MQARNYTTAIRSATASAEAILRRFAKANAMHPIYQAMIEVGAGAVFPTSLIPDLSGHFDWSAALSVGGVDVSRCPAQGKLAAPGSWAWANAVRKRHRRTGTKSYLLLPGPPS